MTMWSTDRRTSRPPGPAMLLALLLSTYVKNAEPLHHMKRDPVHWVNQRDSNVVLAVSNLCQEDIYPGIQTQSGTGPASNGFKLSPGASKNQSVSADWQGRVWARTNCSFNSDGTGPATAGGNNGNGQACLTGDCGGTIQCLRAGQPPASLAEFTLQTNSGQTYYDLSLVDGYNLPIGIISLLPSSGNVSLEDIPPNLTNPVCIGTAALLAAQRSNSDATFGTNDSFPLPLDQSVSMDDVQKWCPWDLQLQPPQKPGDGVYPYPDDNIQRPMFDPCISACSKWNKPSDCCTGSYDSPSSCKPSYYSQSAKKICPDAYSYAFDDQSSTFIVPSSLTGAGWEVVFCPAGRSSTILTTFKSQLQQLGQMGKVTPDLVADAQNITLIRSNGGPRWTSGRTLQIRTSLLTLLTVAAVSISWG